MHPWLRLTVTEGGGGQGGAEWQPGLLWPTHITNLFLREKMKLIEGARNWRSIVGTQTLSFFWLLTPPPPRPGIGHGRH